MHTVRAPTLQKFNLILQKFYEMISEMIVSKTVCGIFLIFCWSRSINNFMMENSFSEPKNQRKLNISRPIYFKKIPAHYFVGLICTNKLEEYFFRKNFYQGLGAFITNATRLIWASFFSTKNQFYTFFQGWLFNFNVILKTCLKNLFKKTLKKWWFYFFKQATRNLQATLIVLCDTK